jgi:3'5'-cyclic nucleotide phosphodiesterase/Adenylate and Guanylate cyclase catalytic domain
VTAGVLRGAKARFQLFGDTVNTSSRIESSGDPGRIHASAATADLLTKSGLAHWVIPRENTVSLKGKGLLSTFWVSPVEMLPSSPLTSETHRSYSSEAKMEENGETSSGDKLMRLVGWNTQVLHDLLVEVVAHSSAKHSRRSMYAAQSAAGSRRGFSKSFKVSKHLDPPPEEAKALVIEEMTEILDMPPFRGRFQNASHRIDVKDQLHQFVSRIAHLYRDVPFHNFEHASHVTMSAGKLMRRILAPNGIDATKSNTEVAHQVHETTYGISSDPLMQFSIVFAALIHDVGHTGLTNKELIDSKSAIAARYREKSVAEQNSVDVAWGVLMEDEFADLRDCIGSGDPELRRFRQLIVNATLATDIADKELQTWRKTRWNAAFSKDSEDQESDYKHANDRKATIVFEYIIQAADVSHCMQHWLTYQKFNARLFEERYIAWLQGVAGENDPSVGWYAGEIWFFDNYIIPLAEKLSACGVFGVSYFECLNYAQANRAEWQHKGREIVAQLLNHCQTKYPRACGEAAQGEDEVIQFYTLRDTANWKS